MFTAQRRSAHALDTRLHPAVTHFGLQNLQIVQTRTLSITRYGAQWRREGFCRPGQTSVLPPVAPSSQIGN